MVPVTYKPGMEVRFLDLSGNFYIAVKAPDTLTENVTFVLPIAESALVTLDGANVWTNTNQWNGISAFVGQAFFGQQLTITRTGTNTAGAITTPSLIFQSDGKSIGDGHFFAWISKRTDNQDYAYGQIIMEIVSPTPGSEEGKIKFQLTRAADYFDILVLHSRFVSVDVPFILKEYPTLAFLTGSVTPVKGMTAFIGDANGPTYLAPAVGGGSVKCPVFYNGTTWVCH